MSASPLALITGASRSGGIGAACAARLLADGWRVVTTGWQAYDERMPWGRDADGLLTVAADLEDPTEPDRLLSEVTAEHGPANALVLAHAESVDSSILDTTVESFDRHLAVNARASWLLIRAFAERFPGPAGSGRIVGITSDHTAFNLPYGASKGAFDRIVLASAVEFAELGITANVINPGPTDTGWITPEIGEAILRSNLQPRLGQPEDCARLVSFLCSPEGGWINGQLLVSDGGRFH